MKHNKLSPNINKCTPANYQPITIHRRLSESIQWWLLYISLKFIAHSKMHLKKATSKPYRVWERVWGAVITRQTIKNNKRNEECRTTICRVEVKGGVNQTRGQTTVKGKIWQQVEWNLYVCFFYLVPVSTSFCSRLSRVGGSRAHLRLWTGFPGTVTSCKKPTHSNLSCIIMKSGNYWMNFTDWENSKRRLF